LLQLESYGMAVTDKVDQTSLWHALAVFAVTA
jgi:hypothetical protein